MRKNTEQYKIVKIGYLKHDLYINTFIDMRNYGKHYDEELTKEEVNEIIEVITDDADIILKEGAKFECYDIDGELLWSDCEGEGIDKKSQDWAEKHLNIGYTNEEYNTKDR